MRRPSYGARKRARLIRRAPYPALKAALHVEVKHLDTDLGSDTLSTTCLVTPLDAVPAGNSSVTRIGRDISLKTLTYNMAVFSGVTQSLPAVVRIYVLLDRAPNGTAPTPEEIFEGGVTTTATSFSLPNWDQRGRFRILKRWSWIIGRSYVGAAQVGPASNDSRTAYGAIGLGGMKLSYHTGNVALKNGIYLVAHADQALSGTTTPLMHGRFRLTFYDA